MPTNAELAKRIEELEKDFGDRVNQVVDDILVKVKSKLDADSALSQKTADDELDELRRSLTFLNKTIEEMKTEREQLKAANKTLVARNQELEGRVSDMEQYSRKNNVEIKGVPTTKGEDCVKILQAIGNKIECPVSESDLDIVHRVPSKGDTKNLIARFLSRTKKNEFVKKARKARLHAKDIGFHGMETRQVYVNDHLTLSNKKLFAKALELKKEKEWKFLWTVDCQIMARKTEESRAIRIKDETDLAIFR